MFARFLTCIFLLRKYYCIVADCDSVAWRFWVRTLEIRFYYAFSRFFCCINGVSSTRQKKFLRDLPCSCFSNSSSCATLPPPFLPFLLGSEKAVLVESAASCQGVIGSTRPVTGSVLGLESLKFGNSLLVETSLCDVAKDQSLLVLPTLSYSSCVRFALSHVWQHVKLSDVSVGARPRHCLVADDDIKKSMLQNSRCKNQLVEYDS